MTRQMNECAEDLVQSLSKEAGTGKSFEIRPYVTFGFFCQIHTTLKDFLFYFSSWNI